MSRRPAPRRRPAETLDDLRRDLPLLILCTLMIGLGFLRGGANADLPYAALALQVLALATLALTAWRLRGRPVWRRPETWLLLALLALPWLQVIPLPPGLWSALPGRSDILETLRVAGLTPAAMPLSVTPDRTVDAFFWLLPPVALFWAGGTLSPRARIGLVGLVTAFLLLSLVLGALQVADALPRLYAHIHENLPIGLFANRNHQAIALAAGLPLVAALARIWAWKRPDRRRAAAWLYLGLTVLLVIGVLVTRSRAGTLLGGVALLAGLWVYWSGRDPGRARTRAVWPLAVGAVALVIVAQLAFGAVLARFDDLSRGDARLDAWPTIAVAAQAHLPTGTGLGSFDPVYRSVEPPGSLRPTFLNEAHNDFLQLWLETGLVFPVLMAAFLILLILHLRRVVRAPVDPQGLLARAALAALVVLLLHSLVDYPLRTQALAGTFALLAACAMGSGGFWTRRHVAGRVADGAPAVGDGLHHHRPGPDDRVVADGDRANNRRARKRHNVRTD